MILIFVATLEQVRIGIRGALAEYFESFYGIWYYPEKFWGGEFLQDIPLTHSGWLFTWWSAYHKLVLPTLYDFNGP